MITLTRESVSIETIDGEERNRGSYQAELDVADFEKGTHSSYMIKEIEEQAVVIRKIVQQYQDTEGNLSVPSELRKSLMDSDRIHIVACGTSYNAGWVGKQLLEKMTEIPVEVRLSSEFSYNPPLITGTPFFIFLTQSGETTDSRQVLKMVNHFNYPTLTITNVAGSTLSREADYTLLLHAGPEIAVASTKAYTVQIAVLAVLAVLADALAKEKKLRKGIDMIPELGIAVNANETIINDKNKIAELADFYLEDTRNAFYIGRGLNYFVSMESVLKLKEIFYIQTEGFATGELKHGTIALVEEGTPVLAFITQKPSANHTRGNIEEVRSHGAKTCVIAMEGLELKMDHLILPSIHLR